MHRPDTPHMGEPDHPRVGPDPALDRITRVTRSLLGSSGALVMWVDDPLQTVTSVSGHDWQSFAGHSSPARDGLCQYVVGEHAPFVVDDVVADPRLASCAAVRDAGIRAYLGVPVTGPSGTTVAALCAIEREPRAWTAADVAQLTDLAALASRELRSRGIGELLEQSEHMAHAHVEFTRALGHALDVRGGIHAALRAIGESLKWHVGGVWLLDEHRESLLIAGSWSDGSFRLADLDSLDEVSFLSGVGIPGRVCRTGRSLWLHDVASEPTFLRKASAEALGLHAHMCVPIGQGSDVIGVLEMFHREPREREQRVLETLEALGMQLHHFITASNQQATVNEVLAIVRGSNTESLGELELDQAASDEQPAPTIPGLTSREHDVLALLTRGSTNREIAMELGIGVDTVKTHVSNILRKLQVPTRSAAIVKALQASA